MSKLRLAMLVVAVAGVLIAVGYVLSRSSVVPAPTFSKVVFDFDNGFPVLIEGQNTSLTQTSEGITANFSSPSDPAAFSVRGYDPESVKLSQFSGKYLFDNRPSRDILDIRFDTEIVHIDVSFATVESQSAIITVPSEIVMTAYRDTVIVGQNETYGSFSDDTYPQGVLSCSSSRPFNWVRIMIPVQTSGTTDFLVDNIIVTLASRTFEP
jgi:hypothetical protein